MVPLTLSVLCLAAVVFAENTTTTIRMKAPPVEYPESLTYSGYVVNVEEDRTTMVLTGSVIGPAAEQSSLDSYYHQGIAAFDTKATRFTFSGTTAFEFKSVWANGMYVNVQRCQEYISDLDTPVHCTDFVQSAWIEVLCGALEDNKEFTLGSMTAITTDDVGSTWTISAPDARWTSDCVEGSDYMGMPGLEVGYKPFDSFPVVITAENAATPTPTEASKTEFSSSVAKQTTQATTSHRLAPSERTAAGVVGVTTSLGFQNTPSAALLTVSLVVFAFVL